MVPIGAHRCRGPQKQVFMRNVGWHQLPASTSIDFLLVRGLCSCLISAILMQQHPQNDARPAPQRDSNIRTSHVPTGPVYARKPPRLGPRSIQAIGWNCMTTAKMVDSIVCSKATVRNLDDNYGPSPSHPRVLIGAGGLKAPTRLLDPSSRMLANVPYRMLTSLWKSSE